MNASRVTGWLKKLGPIGIGVYLSLTALTYAAAMMLGHEGLVRLGLELPSGASTASVVGLAWIASKVTQPLRFGATLVLTPLILRLFGRSPPAEKVAAPPPAEKEA